MPSQADWLGCLCHRRLIGWDVFYAADISKLFSAWRNPPLLKIVHVFFASSVLHIKSPSDESNMNVRLVAFGGAFGAMARFGISSLVIRCYDVSFPVGTMIANITGCFLMGLLIGSRVGDRMPWLKHHVGIGFLGSLTTFSTFSAETLGLFRQERWAAAGSNVGASLILGLLAVAIGIALGQKLVGPAPAAS